MTERQRHPAAAAHFVALAGTLRDVARAHGYALGVHGSLTTDMDLIAAPWVEDAQAPEVLVEALRASVHGFMNSGPFTSCSPCQGTGVFIDCPHVAGMHNPSRKPHGRLAWSIHLDADFSGPYLDVSVMPRARPAVFGVDENGWLPGEQAALENRTPPPSP